MTGQEIYNIMKKKHVDFVNHKSDDMEQPSMKITTQQCFKLAEHIGWQNKHYNSLNSLGEGSIGRFCFESVILEKDKSND